MVTNFVSNGNKFLFLKKIKLFLMKTNFVPKENKVIPNKKYF